MKPLLQKLNFKGQPAVALLSLPADLQSLTDTFALETTVYRTLDEVESIPFVLAFVTRQEEVAALAALVAEKAPGDSVVWFAYPKRTSKRYQCDLNRDTGWQVLGDNGFEGVRMVAIDEDWSALRFRRAEFVRTMKRDAARAMSETGRAKVAD